MSLPILSAYVAMSLWNFLSLRILNKTSPSFELTTWRVVRVGDMSMATFVAADQPSE
jgi:hypothetical protein